MEEVVSLSENANELADIMIYQEHGAPEYDTRNQGRKINGIEAQDFSAYELLFLYSTI